MILKGTLSLFMAFAVFGISEERINAENISSGEHGTQESQRSLSSYKDNVDEESISLWWKTIIK